jgi:hypothetical protein
MTDRHHAIYIGAVLLLGFLLNLALIVMLAGSAG